MRSLDQLWTPPMTNPNHTDTSRSGDLVERLRKLRTELAEMSDIAFAIACSGQFCEDNKNTIEGCIADGLDRIEALEAENERLRRDRETLLTFARAIQTWRSDADSYDSECDNPQRNYCEDVELMEDVAGIIIRQVKARAALKEIEGD